MLMASVVFGQAQQGADKLYYDKDGRLFTGITRDYYPDSALHAEFEIQNGVLSGSKVYFNNGKLEEIRSFREGMMHGKWEKWNQQEVKIAEANYTDNLKDGKWYIWDENGTLRYDMTYIKGEKSGVWMMYDEKGKVISQKSY